MIDKLYIKPEVKRKLEAYVRHCKFEISGLGEVEEIDGKLVVTNIFLLKQEGSGASTTLDPEALSLFLTDYVMEGGDPSKLKWWWHSHCHMNAYWSSTDDKCMNSFSPGDYFVATVMNKKGEQRSRLDFYKPLRASVDNLPLELYYEGQETLDEEIKKEIEEKVTELVLTVPKGKWSKGKTGNNSFTSKYRDDDIPPYFTEHEFNLMANEYGLTFNELLEQEGMALHASGYVY